MVQEFLSHVRTGAKLRPPVISGTQMSAYFMMFLFAGGIFFGGLTGFYHFPAAGSAVVQAAEIVPDSLRGAVWVSCRFFVLLALLSSSYLGVVLVPATVLARGYLLSCSVAALYASNGWRGLLWAALVSGVPALLLTPVFLLGACDAFSLSQHLLYLRLGRMRGPEATQAAKHASGAALLAAVNTIYMYWLLPLLLQRVS